MMEAANRGASRAKAKNIGLNISLPFEQYPNNYITPDLNFEFHYFFMRKFWFIYYTKARGAKQRFFPGVLEGLGSSGRLVGTISAYPGTPPTLW